MNKVSDTELEHKKYYDKFWSQEMTIRELRQKKHGRREVILSVVRHYKVRNILEVGCGLGLLSVELAEMAPTLGIDMSDGAKPLWDKLKRENQSLDFVIGDFLTFDFQNRKFDLIVTSEVIEHIPHEQQPEFILKIRRLLDQKGYLVMTTPNAPYVLPRLTSKTRQPVEDQLDKSEFANLVSSAGFDILIHRLLFPDLLTRENRVYWTLKRLRLERIVYRPLIYRIQNRFHSESICKYQLLVARRRND